MEKAPENKMAKVTRRRENGSQAFYLVRCPRCGYHVPAPANGTRVRCEHCRTPVSWSPRQ